MKQFEYNIYVAMQVSPNSVDYKTKFLAKAFDDYTLNEVINSITSNEDNPMPIWPLIIIQKVDAGK